MKKLSALVLALSCCMFTCSATARCGPYGCTPITVRHPLFVATIIIISEHIIDVVTSLNPANSEAETTSFNYGIGLFYPTGLTATGGCTNPYPAPFNGCYYEMTSSGAGVTTSFSGDVAHLHSIGSGVVLALSAPTPASLSASSFGRIVNGILIPANAVSLQYVSIPSS